MYLGMLLIVLGLVVGVSVAFLALVMLVIGNCTYTYLSTKWIQPVSPNNRYMNYGYWQDPLLRANEALVDLVLARSGQAQKANNRVLDVGCGYGEQDHYLIRHLAEGSHITAVDLNPLDVRPHPNIDFKQMDACNLQFSEKFDTVFSIESAFHYADRPKFLKTVAGLLADDGVFAMTDILCDRHNPVTYFMQRLLKIPVANLIPFDEWKQTLEAAGLDVVYHQDLTANTFRPYYNHLLNWVMSGVLTRVQPFTYHLVVCKKKR